MKIVLTLFLLSLVGYLEIQAQSNVEERTYDRQEKEAENCKFKLKNVDRGMGIDEVRHITGNASDSVWLTSNPADGIVIWFFNHEEKIDHSIEFVNGIVEDVIFDYKAYQQEIMELRNTLNSKEE